MTSRLLFFLLWTAASACAEMSCVGLIVSQEKMLFAVCEHNRSMRWVSLGDTIDGFVVSSYDAQKEELLLRRESEVLVLRLLGSKVRSSTVAGDTSALSSLEYAYALALGGDEELARKITALDGMVRLKVQAEKELEIAKAELANGDENAKARMMLHAAQVRAREGLREKFLQLLIQAAEAKRPNKAPL